MWEQFYNKGDRVVRTCSLSSVSCPDRLATSLMVDSSFSCRFLISFCSPSPSLLTRDMARIRGNQSRLCSWWSIKQTSDWFYFFIIFSLAALINTEFFSCVISKNLSTWSSTFPPPFQKHLHSLNISNLPFKEPMKIFKREKRRWEVTDLLQRTQLKSTNSQASWEVGSQLEKKIQSADRKVLLMQNPYGS